MSAVGDIDAILGLTAEDVAAARRPMGAGFADPAILRSSLRIECKLDTVAALLTEIRDRLPNPSAAPALAPAIDPAPTPAPPPPAKRPRGS